MFERSAQEDISFTWRTFVMASMAWAVVFGGVGGILYAILN